MSVGDERGTGEAGWGGYTVRQTAGGGVAGSDAQQGSQTVQLSALLSVRTLQRARQLAQNPRGACRGIFQAHERKEYRQRLLDNPREPLPCGSAICRLCLNHQGEGPWERARRIKCIKTTGSFSSLKTLGISICKKCTRNRKLKQAHACPACLQAAARAEATGTQTTTQDSPSPSVSNVPQPVSLRAAAKIPRQGKALAAGDLNAQAANYVRKLWHRCVELMQEISRVAGPEAEIRAQIYIPPARIQRAEDDRGATPAEEGRNGEKRGPNATLETYAWGQEAQHAFSDGERFTYFTDGVVVDNGKE